jgi:hypothetical protein
MVVKRATASMLVSAHAKTHFRRCKRTSSRYVPAFLWPTFGSLSPPSKRTTALPAGSKKRSCVGGETLDSSCSMLSARLVWIRSFPCSTTWQRNRLCEHSRHLLDNWAAVLLADVGSTTLTRLQHHLFYILEGKAHLDQCAERWRPLAYKLLGLLPNAPPDPDQMNVGRCGPPLRDNMVAKDDRWQQQRRCMALGNANELTDALRRAHWPTPASTVCSWSFCSRSTRLRAWTAAMIGMPCWAAQRAAAASSAVAMSSTMSTCAATAHPATGLHVGYMRR